ncbi:MAG: penicillin acylase family protein [Spirochaetota bacterium]
MKWKRSPFDIFLRRGFPRVRGKATGLPLSSQVEVLRDGFGIPHIFAHNERDMIMAQGFVHAQDRLWQMETIRRMASGTLAEVAGEKAVELDVFSRIAGFSTLRERALRALSDDEKELMEAYTTGINAYLEQAGKRLPLEFRVLKFKPSPWKCEEVGSSLAINAWFLETNFREELLALLGRKNLTIQLWNEIFPSHPDEDIAEEDFFIKFRDLKIGRVIPEALGFYPELFIPASASNNWVVAEADGGLPLLANDPHMSMVVPQIWYFCHLSCPTMNVCGASLPGSPGIVLGRNEHIGWGATNVMTDCVDLYILRVEPDNPERYYVKDEIKEMEKEHITISVSGGKRREAIIYRTIHGPVITEVKRGVEAVVTLKWYGTLEEGVLHDRTMHGFLSLMRAESVEQALDECKSITTVCQNFVMADEKGHIGWCASGAVPLREGYTGRLPADGSSGKNLWSGFIPLEKMPWRLDPGEGYIATANNRIVDGRYPHKITHSWCAPYRYERIFELLKGLESPQIDDFRKIQLDNYSIQAERIIPNIVRFKYSNPLAVEASELLKVWDFTVSGESRQALIFNVFLVEFAHVLLESFLGDAMPLFLSLMPFMYTGVDRVLEKGQGSNGNGSTILNRRKLDSLCEQALVKTMQFISETLGRKRKNWRWGNLHTYHYKHPGAEGGVSSWLLNRGPYPASGNGSTINASPFNPAHRGGAFERYRTSVVPSMRMVVSLADEDSTFIIGPMGQSGQPGSKHYADMIEPWMKGELVQIPLIRKAVEKISIKRVVLIPNS